MRPSEGLTGPLGQQDVWRGRKDSQRVVFFFESFAIPRSSSEQQPNDGGKAMKWTLVRYKARPDRAEENQRLSAAVFGELQQKAPAGLHYAVFRLPDDTFVHLASLEDGATPLSPPAALPGFSMGPRAPSFVSPTPPLPTPVPTT